MCGLPYPAIVIVKLWALGRSGGLLPWPPVRSLRVEYSSPAPLIAFVLAMVSGSLIATQHYIAGAVTGALAIVVFGLWRFAVDRGDDDRHTLW
jgi:hypothetical protein